MPEAISAASAIFHFEPSADRARFLDRRMRLRLRDSLAHIFEQSRDHLTLHRTQLDRFLSRLAAYPVSPLAFSLYCDLVIAIEGDELDEAGHLIDELVALPWHRPGLEILDLGDPQRDPVAQRYARFIDSDPDVPFQIFPPSAKAAEACRRQIYDALALMDAGDRKLAEEIRALLREVILAAGTEDPKALTFDGASAFMLWGAIIINANRQDGELGMVQMLAHESAHNLLFGMTTDEPLLFNSPEERFASPLRADPRPLEGIYHATFVAARMYRALRVLLESRGLSAIQETQARKDLADNLRFFKLGSDTIKRHGRLTDMGEAIFQNVCGYMADAE